MKKKKWLIFAAVLAAAALVFLLWFLFGRRPALSYDREIELGRQDLFSANYEQAVISFTAAIRIDPSSTDAYLGRADAYAGLNKLAEALKDLEAAIDLDASVAQTRANQIAALSNGGTYEDEEGNRFDVWGHQLHSVGYDGSGNIMWTRDRVWASATKEVSETAYDAGGNQISQVLLVYDENGRATTDVCYYNDDSGIIFQSDIQYDADGNMTTQRVTGPNGTVAHDLTYVYANGVLTQETDQQADGSRVETAYAANGKDKTETTYDASGALSSRREYVYTTEGDETVCTCTLTEGDSAAYTEWVERTSSTGMTKTYYEPDGTVQTRIVSEYSENGTTTTIYDGDGTVHQVVTE